MKTSIVKKIAYIAAAMTMAVSATACGSTDSGSAATISAAADSAANAETAAAAKLTTDITVVSREDGSCTRTDNDRAGVRINHGIGSFLC